MREIIRMMSEIKQPYLRKYLWLSCAMFLVNILWGGMNILLSDGTAYRFDTYHIPEIAPITLRFTILIFLIFQLWDAVQFMNKGSLKRIMLLPTRRCLYPITQMLFTFLCVLLLWGAFCGSILISYGIFSMRFGFVRDGLVYVLLSEPLIHTLLPLLWDQIINLLVAMMTFTVVINAICLFLQAPISIFVQVLLILVSGFVIMIVGDSINQLALLSPYLLGAICMGIVDVLSIAYTFYIFQIGKASDGL